VALPSTVGPVERTAVTVRRPMSGQARVPESSFLFLGLRLLHFRTHLSLAQNNHSAAAYAVATALP